MYTGWVCWLTPVIPALLEAKAGESLRPGVETSLGNIARPVSTEVKNKNDPGVVVHICHPGYLGG